MAVQRLELEGAEEALHDGVVVGVAHWAHGQQVRRVL